MAVMAVPFYFCFVQHDGLPTFFSTDPCASIVPQTILVRVTSLEDPVTKKAATVGDISKSVCAEALPMVPSLECEAMVTRHVNYDMTAHNFRTTAGGGDHEGNQKLWISGNYPLESRIKDTMVLLDATVANTTGRTAGDGVEGNTWRWQGIAPDALNAMEPERAQSKGEKMANARRCLLLASAMAFEVPRPRVLEIGFNAGHSSGMFLSTFPDVTVTSVDICHHAYTRPAYDRLRELFPGGRLTLHCGNSVKVVPKLADEDPGLLAAHDTVFIDGGHLYVVAFHDLLAAAPYAKPGALVVVDDCSTNMHRREDGSDPADAVFEYHVSLAFQHAVALGIVEPLKGDVCGDANVCLGRYRKHETAELLAGLLSVS
jgi:predicted O-methyltransferase YrrM